MAGEAGGDVEARHRRHGGDHGHRIRRRVDQAGPAFTHLRLREGGEGVPQVAQPLPQQAARRRRVKHADLFERSGLVERPAPLPAQFVQEAAADPQPQLAPGRAQGRQELLEEPEAVRDDLGDAGIAPGDGEAAILAPPHGEVARPQGAVGHPLDRGGTQHRTQQLELGQIDAEVAAEQARPGAPGQHDRLARDRAAFGHDPRDAAALQFQPPHGAVPQHVRTLTPRRAGHGWNRLLRLGNGVGRGVEGAGEAPLRSRQHRGGGSGVEQLRVDLPGPRMVQPRLQFGQLTVGVAGPHAAGLAEADIGADPLLHLVPEAQALQSERDLVRVPAHHAAPSPVAAGLFGRDAPLLADGDADALGGEREGCGDARDAAADHHHVGAVRQGFVVVGGLQVGEHQACAAACGYAACAAAALSRPSVTSCATAAGSRRSGAP